MTPLCVTTPAAGIAEPSLANDGLKNQEVFYVNHCAGLILPRGVEKRIEAEANTSGDTVIVRLRDLSAAGAALPESIVHYVVRTRDRVILDDASAQNSFSADTYIRQHRARSVLCLPLINQARLIGVLYLENNLTPYVFNPTRIAVLELLASQAAISLENASLYSDLQRSEAFLAQGQTVSHTGSFGWNVRSGEIYWSEETHKIFEQDRVTKPTLEWIMQRTHPDDLQNALDFEPIQALRSHKRRILWIRTDQMTRP